MTALVVRSLVPDDDDAIRALFRATLAMGKPIEIDEPVLDDYASLCLDWYLTEGRAVAAVVEDRHRVVGYALVCTVGKAHAGWSRTRAVAFGRRAIAATALGRLTPKARRFVRLRIHDALTLLAAPVPRPVHAHMNVHPTMQRSWAALLLRDHIDTVCRDARSTGWYGEVNAKVGRRAVALERLVGPIVHRAPNRTCTWLAGEPVERLTVVRDIGA